jgi:hypothetical protein
VCRMRLSVRTRLRIASGVTMLSPPSKQPWDKPEPLEVAKNKRTDPLPNYGPGSPFRQPQPKYFIKS